VEATFLPGFSEVELDGLRSAAAEAQYRLDALERCCLVHSDFNPKNMVLDPDTLQVCALLDWEFAHAGVPGIDLGNLLRFDRQPAYVESVVAAYVGRSGRDPVLVLEQARAADLWALVELASRVGQNPVANQAHALLRAIARTGDLSAVAD
jgi:aminoglycoside phosphotransferase (APT) family kinase protein